MEKKENSTPDFQVLLAALQSEQLIMVEQIKRIKVSAFCLKEMIVDEEEKGLLRKEPNCIVDKLWNEIYNIKENNYELKAIANHLETIIGK